QAHAGEADARRVAEEDLGEAAADHGAEAGTADRLRRVLAARAAAEVRAGDHHRGAGPRGVVERMALLAAVRRVPLVVEQRVAEAVEGHRLEEPGGHDAVGVDVVAGHGHRRAADAHDGLERAHATTSRPTPNTSRASEISPVTAAAATITGLIRTVRPVGEPWRPLKLRFDDEAQSWSPTSLSGFIARHIEQPASRHSKPAALKTLSMPRRSHSALTRSEPGTAIAFTRGWTRRPARYLATSTKSESRAFVQEPKKATSMGVPAIGLPPSSFMWASASATAARSLSGTSSGRGTGSSMATAWPGFTPQVTVGGTSSARISTTSS